VTGSGKSALGIELASLYNGEIVAADSKTVYKGMDISTAKPTKSERSAVVHHLIDVVSPAQAFTVADFKVQAKEAIDDIVCRGKVPFLVGGTGLYVDALLYDFTLRPMAIDQNLRAQLSRLSIDELQCYILQRGLVLPRDNNNPRRLIRTIESNGAIPHRDKVRPDTLIVGLYIDRENLRKRIILRVNSMVKAGLVDELKALAAQYEWHIPALQTPGCKAFRGFLESGLTLDEAIAAFVQNDMNLAKRQYTWFKRNKDVHWVNSKEESVELVTTFLNKY
jgi:tRNA dimethylallyltransferase